MKAKFLLLVSIIALSTAVFAQDLDSEPGSDPVAGSGGWRNDEGGALPAEAYDATFLGGTIWNAGVRNNCRSIAKWQNMQHSGITGFVVFEDDTFECAGNQYVLGRLADSTVFYVFQMESLVLKKDRSCQK